YGRGSDASLNSDTLQARTIVLGTDIDHQSILHRAASGLPDDKPVSTVLRSEVRQSESLVQLVRLIPSYLQSYLPSDFGIDNPHASSSVMTCVEFPTETRKD